MNQLIQEWQNALPAFGINYSGPKDGVANAAFINAMFNLEIKLKMYGKLFDGAKPLLPPSKLQDKLPKSEETQEVKVKEEESTKSQEVKSDKKENPTDPLDIQSQVELNKEHPEWESFLKQSLPVAGNIYDGDLGSTAKKLESVIGKEINKPMTGVIWNDSKKQFNTTTDDIKKALEKIQMHKASTPKISSTLDERIVKIAEILRENDLKKITDKYTNK